MPLSILLDEHMSAKVVKGIKRARPDTSIECVNLWRDGVFRGALDAFLLRAARAENLTLITYDLSTIQPLLTEWGTIGEDHAGVVLVDEQTIAQDDFGGQIRAILLLVERYGNDNWTNRAMFLQPAR